MSDTVSTKTRSDDCLHESTDRLVREAIHLARAISTYPGLSQINSQTVALLCTPEHYDALRADLGKPSLRTVATMFIPFDTKRYVMEVRLCGIRILPDLQS
jgi:hypothetical protein